MNFVQKYLLRPSILKNFCLADFVANFNISKSSNNKFVVDDINDDQNDIEIDELSENIDFLKNKLKLVPEVLILDYKNKTDLLYLHKRSITKIIRFNVSDIEIDRRNFFREQILLFYPWTEKMNDEEKFFDKEENFEQFCYDNLHIIKNNRKCYCIIDSDKFLEKIENEILQDRKNFQEEIEEKY